ncbi:MAG: NAD(P)/FAD-dependent oxidoreductase [Hyphomicrobiales bacterium]|nr:NAD(P)/FAD-dependent oxidoreductase [Hyphomicrobiales bacterium]
MTRNIPTFQRPRVVIVGAGFGGLAAARRLAGTPVDVTIIDQRNYHLFQPLLYQVATAALSPADVAWPIRGIFAKNPNVRVVLGKVTGADLEQKVVRSDRINLPYDYLILATGAYHSYFGHDEWAMHAPGLKRVIDATEIRKRVLLAFERAEVGMSEAEQRRELTFVVIGGGPAGVEMAGAVAELARYTLARDFRKIDPRSARVILVEAGDRLLRAFPEDLSAYAKRALERLGVEVLLSKRVEVRGEEGAFIGDMLIPCATMIWAAGVAVPHLKNWLPVETDRTGRVPVEPDLSITGHAEVFVVGDAAAVSWKGALTVPGIAPAAKQGGRYVADVIVAAVRGESKPAPFRYRHRGNLATIGRHAAIVDFGRVKLTGRIAWWLWGFAHIYFLIGVRAPMIVAAQWFWAYLTFGRGARLITGLQPLFEDLNLPKDSARVPAVAQLSAGAVPPPARSAATLAA